MSRLIRSRSTITTDITFEGAMSFGNALQPPQITGHQNDYNPVGLQETILILLNSSGNFSVTGLQKPVPDGTRVIYIFNIGANNIVFKDNDAGSLAANRILLGANKTVQNGEGLILIYDNISQRWRVPAINI